MEKKYYSISEVSNMLEIAQTKLRYWESEFKELKPQVSPGGTRRYTKDDIIIIRAIQNLLKVQNLTIEGAKHRLNKSFDAELSKATAIDKLLNVRNELMKIRLELNDNEAMIEDSIVD